jgi:CheY-like chemotaxis protein
VRGYVSAVVRRAGAEAQSAASVQEAIRAVQQHLPDVVLCDIAMPQEDGYAFLAWMRSVPWPRHVPVVALTAFGRPEDRQRMLDAGFDDYVRKPVEPTELAAVIKTQAERKMKTQPNS